MQRGTKPVDGSVTATSYLGRKPSASLQEPETWFGEDHFTYLVTIAVVDSAGNETDTQTPGCLSIRWAAARHQMFGPCYVRCRRQRVVHSEWAWCCRAARRARGRRLNAAGAAPGDGLHGGRRTDDECDGRSVACLGSLPRHSKTPRAHRQDGAMSMWRSVAIFVFAALAAISCHGTTSSTANGDCVTGWWEGSSTTCVTACALKTPPAECTATDCQLQTYVAFLSDGTYQSGAITISQKMQEFSEFGVPTVERWARSAADSLEIQHGDGGFEMEVSCDTQSLAINYTGSYERFSSEVETALDAARISGQWVAHHFGP